MHYNADELVHFDGDWPARNLPVPDGLFGRPWICTLRCDGECEEYFARRVNLETTIYARSASAFIDQLRNEVGYRRRDGW